MTKETLFRLQRIDHLISIKGTGTPSQLARKVGISKRSIYDHLNLMKEFGAPIKYCHIRNSYYYDEDGKFQISFLFVKQDVTTGVMFLKNVTTALFLTQVFA